MALTFKKILKNTTQAEIEIESAGISVSTTEDFEIDSSEYILFAKDRIITELTPYINSGDIVVSTGSDDLDALEGIAYLQYPDRQITRRTAGDKVLVPEVYDFEGNVSVVKDGTRARVIIGGDDDGISNLGNIFRITFLNQSSTKNKWLGYWGNSFTSSLIPGLLEYDCKLIGISFSNARDNSDSDVEIYKNGTSTKVYTWEVRDKRYAWKTNNIEINFTKGDRIAVYAKDQGTDPLDMTVTLTFKVTSDDTGEGGSSTL